MIFKLEIPARFKGERTSESSDGMVIVAPDELTARQYAVAVAVSLGSDSLGERAKWMDIAVATDWTSLDDGRTGVNALLSRFWKKSSPSIL
jgi:hypothetical protein